MATEVADDELTPEEIEEQRRQRASQPIGKPIQAPASGSSTPTIGDAPQGEQSQTPLPKQDAPPEMSGQSPVTISGSQPIAPYPTPEQSKAATMEATPYRPKGGTIGRIADTIAGSTNIGRAVEEAGRVGTYGHMANVQGQEQAAAEEQGREKAAEGEQQSQATVGKEQATAEEQRALAGQHQAQSHMVTLTLSDGRTLTMPQTDADRYLQSSATNTSKEGISANTNQTKENTTKESVAGREQVAETNAAGKPAATKTIEEGGKPHVMAWNPQTKAYDRDMGEAPPSGQGSAYAATRTAIIFDDRGIPTVMQYNSTTGRYDIPVGTSAAGAFGNRASAAGAGERAGEQLITDIQNYTQAHKDDYFSQLGTLGAWVAKNGLNTPIADPDLAGMQAELGSFAALQPVIHGFRGTDALDTFNKIIGGLQQNPAATIASIQGILKTINQINPPKGQPTPQASTGGLTIERDANGRIIGVR